MNILLIHQNYPAQFRHIAPALVKAGHRVVAMQCTPKVKRQTISSLDGVQVVSIPIGRNSTPGIHPWLIDFESKCIRGEAVLHGALKVRAEGFSPDVIWAHPGWGESLFVKKVWPLADLRLYCEFYYNDDGADSNFDPEFAPTGAVELSQSRLMIKNINQLLHFQQATGGLAPTNWQKKSYPDFFQEKITVVHDGIDTDLVKPNPSAVFEFKDAKKEKSSLSRRNKVVTFVNRNLEPYRGYHVFMRALPLLLEKDVDVQVVLVGGEGVSYGSAAPTGTSWAEIYRKEVFPLLTLQQRSRVHFVGTLPYSNYLNLLQVSSVHVYLTYPFVLSWSLLEAMSAGCAVVASSTGPLHDVIQHGKNGVLVDFFDSDALANETLRLLNNNVVASQLGYAARSTVVQNHDLKTRSLPTIVEWLTGHETCKK